MEGDQQAAQPPGAGAERAKLFVLAIDDEEVAVESARAVKQHFPHIKVLARARNRAHAHALLKAGADIYQRETFSSAVELGRTTLRQLGYGAYRAHRVARTFAKHDTQTLKESFAFYDDEKRLISFAHAMRDDIDRVMQADEEDIDRGRTTAAGKEATAWKHANERSGST